MKKQRFLLLAGAVAAALAAPYAAAQRPMDRSADTYRADRGAWVYGDPDYYHGRRAWQTHPRAHIGPDNAYHSPTDGRSGGAGIPAENGVVPSTSPLVSSGEPPYPPSRLAGTYDDRSAGPVRSTDPTLNPERSATDGRSGGTNVPSATSGAVPSTQPPDDARAGREIGGYRSDPAYRAPSPTTIR